jgi:TusA-related sulfurtransferase
MSTITADQILDVRGEKCPMPIVKAKKALATLTPGQVLRVEATDKGSVLDFQGWARTAKTVELVSQTTEADPDGRDIYVHFLSQKG